MEQSQKKKITGAAVIVMSSIIVSRVTGFLRTTLITNMIKSKIETDALFMAFTITDLMFFLLVGGAIAAALIPVLSGYLAKGEEEEGWKAVGSFINVIFVGITLLSCLGIIFAPQVVDLIAQGFTNPETRNLTISITRILFPSVSFLMLTGLMNGVLNSYQRFASAAYGPTLYNLGAILSVLFLSRYGVKYVAVGIMCSAIMYFLFQLSFTLRNLKHYRFKIYLKHPGFIRLIKLAIPSLLASSIVQINVMISASYTSNFRAGSVTALKNATDVWQLPYGIFAMGMGMAILPSMSERLALKDTSAFKSILLRSLKTVFLLVIPSVIGLIVLGEPVISAIYKWSPKIDAETINITYRLLMFFTIALITQSIVAIISRGFYANNDTKTPLYVGAVTIAINGILCFIFYRYTSFDASGMALAYSLSSAVNAIMLTVLLDKKMKGLELDKITFFFIKVIGAALLMGLALYFLNRAIPVNVLHKFNLQSKLVELGYLLIEVAIGIAVYFISALLMKVDEAVYVYRLTLDKIKGITGRNSV